VLDVEPKLGAPLRYAAERHRQKILVIVETDVPQGQPQRAARRPGAGRLPPHHRCLQPRTLA
jgi:hypothetical protein